MKSSGMFTVKMGECKVRDVCDITAVGRWGLRALLHKLRLRVLSESARVNSRIRAPIKIIQSQHAPTPPPSPLNHGSQRRRGGGGSSKYLARSTAIVGAQPLALSLDVAKAWSLQVWSCIQVTPLENMGRVMRTHFRSIFIR